MGGLVSRGPLGYSQDRFIRPPAAGPRRRFMRSIAVLASLLAASPAWAGGIGLLVGGGARTEQIYYYSDSQIPASGGDAVQITDEDLWPQYELDALIGQG